MRDMLNNISIHLIPIRGTECHNFESIGKMFNDCHVVVINIECWNVVIQIPYLNDYL